MRQNQMKQIRLGLMTGMDVSKYSSKENMASLMEEIRLELQDEQNK